MEPQVRGLRRIWEAAGTGEGGLFPELAMRISSLPNAFSLKRGGKVMSGKQSSRKEKPSADMQKSNKANLGQKEAGIEKEKASELASMGEKSAQSDKND